MSSGSSAKRAGGSAPEKDHTPGAYATGGLFVVDRRIMIPYFRAPISPAKAISALLSPKRAPGTIELERAYADAFGVSDAVLLPSNRAGVYMVLKLTAGPDTVITGPAYTCTSVHDAMRLTGARLRYLDTAPNEFLMAAEDLVAAAKVDSCQVLSEIHGIPYNETILRAGPAPCMRIWDVAQSIPDKARTRRMSPREAAIVSFGMGKCMAAGRGGVALFNNSDLASRVREMRDSLLRKEPWGQSKRDGLMVLAKAIGYRRAVYRFIGVYLHWTRVRAGRANASSRGEQSCEGRLDWCDVAKRPEWTLPMSALNRKLAADSLLRMHDSLAARSRNAEVYYECLKDYGVVRGIAPPAWPQSNFPIRIPQPFRPQLQRYLREHGIDSGKLFSFSSAPGLISRFPNALNAAKEILTLPIGEEVSPADVRRICRCVVDGLRELHIEVSD
jgi:dTDP-4-amino-4,6-dideoxygalactose transaminase